MSRSCFNCPSQKHLPNEGSLKFKQTTTRGGGGRGSTPAFLEINWKFRRRLLLSAVQLGRKEMITLLCLASRHFPQGDAEPTPSPKAPEPGAHVTSQGVSIQDGPVTAQAAPLVPELLHASFTLGTVWGWRSSPLTCQAVHFSAYAEGHRIRE